MYRCFYYWLIAPLRGRVEDSPTREAAFALTVNDLDGKDYALSLYCDSSGIPEFGRVVLPDLATKEIPENTLPLIQTLQEHLLTVLRLTFRADTMLAQPSAVWSFVAGGQPQSINLDIQMFGSNSYNPQRTKDLFVHTFELRELLRLFVDGSDERIPLQYRFLSLYKMLESRFRKNGRWDNSALALYLAPYAARFVELGFTGRPAALFHDLRDRCAHIRTGSRGKPEILGVTHLNLKEIVRIERVFPQLRKICTQLLNDRLLGKVTITTAEGMGGLQPVHDGLLP